jgi:hypothetical protein
MSYQQSLEAENDCLKQTLMDLSDHIIKDISKGDVTSNSATAWAGFKAFLLLEQLNYFKGKK